MNFFFIGSLSFAGLQKFYFFSFNCLVAFFFNSLTFFKGLIDYCQFLVFSLIYLRNLFISSLRTSIISLSCFQDWLLVLQECWNIQELLYCDGWAVVTYYIKYCCLCSYTNIHAFGFEVIKSMGTNFHVCLCWLVIFFIGFCFLSTFLDPTTCSWVEGLLMIWGLDFWWCGWHLFYLAVATQVAGWNSGNVFGFWSGRAVSGGQGVGLAFGVVGSFC